MPAKINIALKVGRNSAMLQSSRVDQWTEPPDFATERISRYERHKLISQAWRWSVKKYLMYAHKYG